MATNFQYVDTAGKTQTVQATSAEEAQRLAPNIASTSGVMAMKSEPIQANDIQSTQPVSVPNVPPQSSGQTIDAIAQESAQRAAQAQEAFDKSRSSLEDRIKEITTVMGSREDLEREQGLDQANLDVADIQNQIEAREHSLRRAIEDTQRTAGLSGTQIARRVSALNRDAARELADLSIIEGARLRRFDSISQNIDRKIKAQLEPLQFQLQFDQMFYQENRQAMTAAQDRAFQMKIMQEDRNYQEAMKEQESIKNIALSAAQFGATGEQITAITDAKNFNDAMQVGGSFLGEGFRQQVAAQKFQQDMSVKTYDLQVRSQNFAEKQAKDAADAKAAQAEQDILDRLTDLNIKANAEFSKTDEAQSLTVVRGQVATVNRILENTIGISDRSDMTDDHWASVAKNMSTVRAIANAEVRALNPDITRAAANGDLNAATSLVEMTEAKVGQLWRGENTRPIDVKNAVVSLDSAMLARLSEADERLKVVETLFPSSQIITTYNRTSETPLRSQITEAIQNGIPNSEIVSELSKNPLFSNTIKELKGWGYLDNKIVEYLMNQ